MNMFSPQKILNVKMCVCFKQKIINHVIFTKSENASVCFFIYMSSMCVQLFIAFEEAVLKLYVPW